MSSRIRALRAMRDAQPQLSEQDRKMLAFLATGQNSNLTDEDTGGSMDDYLNGPSMASILLKQAKGELLREQMKEDGSNAMTPMIASILQLDR